MKENITKETEFKKKQIETLEMKSSINEIKYKIILRILTAKCTKYSKKRQN